MSKEDGFNLRITFTGLCLFVPEGSAPAGGPLHVLLPDAHHAHGHGVEFHIPLLIWDAAHERPDSSGWRYRHLHRKELVLPAGTAGIGPNLPPVIADIDAVNGRNLVDRNNLRDVPPPQLAARVHLSGGKVHCCEPGVLWELPDPSDERELTHEVHWLIEGIAGDRLDALKLRILDCPTDKGQPPIEEDLPPLYPVPRPNGTAEIHLQVYNGPPAEVPPARVELPKNVPYYAKHFLAYYGLLRPPYGQKHIPVRRTNQHPVGKPCHEKETDSAGTMKTAAPELKPKWAGQPLTCLTGQATLAAVEAAPAVPAGAAEVERGTTP